MEYQRLKYLTSHKNEVFAGYNSADGSTNDTSTDAVVTRDPNNFLVTKINGMTVVNTVTIIVGILAIIILAPKALHSLKSLI